MKKLSSLLIIGLSLGLPFIGLANNNGDATQKLNKLLAENSNPPVNYKEIAKAVEQGVGKVLIYPMKQFASVVKYTFDTRAAHASAVTQSRYPELPYLQQVTAQNTQQIAAEMASLSTEDPDNAEATLAQSKLTNACTNIGGKKVCYPEASAQTLLSTDQYNSTQQQAAQQFVQTAAGAYITLPPPKKKWNNKDPNVIKYKAFYKTMGAIHSIAQHNLSYSYAIRSASGDQPSELSLYHDIMTKDATNPDFWNEINHIPVVGQLVTIANYMPALAIGISQENKYLEMINNSLSAMLAQQSLLVQNSTGEQLYQQADNPKAANAMNGNYNT